MIAAGFACSTVAFVLNAALSPSAAFAHMLSLGITAGVLIVFGGSIALARAKGRPWYFGLLGLLSVFGVAILWFAVPDAPAS